MYEVTAAYTKKQYWLLRVQYWLSYRTGTGILRGTSSYDSISMYMYPRRPGPGARPVGVWSVCGEGVACGGPTDRPYSVLRRVLLRVAVDSTGNSTGNRWKPVVGARTNHNATETSYAMRSCDGRTVSDV